MDKYAIYAIDCPDYDGGIKILDSQVYFGKTGQGIKARLRGHSWPEGGCPRLRNWLKARRAQGYTFRVQILKDGLTNDEANRLEIALIARHRSTHNVMNLTTGGEGMPGYRHTAEARAKISVANFGRKRSPEALINIGNASRGRIPSIEARQRMSLAQRGRKHTPETKAKIGAAHKGSKRSPEAKAKMSLAARARKPKNG